MFTIRSEKLYHRADSLLFRKEPLSYSCGKQPHLHNTLSLPAEGGGLRSKTEGECGTFKSAITIVYAFSLSHLRLWHARGALAYRNIVGTNLDVTPHPPPKVVPLPPLGKACINR